MTLATTARAAEIVSPPASRTPVARPPATSTRSTSAPVRSSPPLSRTIAGQRLDEPDAAAARHGHAAELDRAGDDLRHEPRDRLLGPEAGVQHPGREQPVRALGLERRAEPVARAHERAAREREQPAPAEAAVGLARERRGPAVDQSSAESTPKLCSAEAMNCSNCRCPGGAVAGRVALELGDVVLERGRQEGGAAVGEQRRRRQRRC